jgi:peptide/nickel transport system permease protein
MTARLPRTVRSVLRRPLGMLGILLIAGLVVAALTAPVVTRYEPDAVNLTERLLAPSAAHLCGTDMLGRDILTRVLYGARVSLMVGAVTVVTALVAGSLLGLVAGYLGGVFDDALMRVTDAFMALPYLVLALAFVSVLGPSLQNALLAITLVWWPKYARLARASVLSLRKNEFVQAATAVGCSHLRIMLRHILPNAVSPLVVQASLDFGEAILVAATLSFIGLGAQPPTSEWGAMISAGRAWLRDAWWVPTFPGLAILLAALGFNLLGDTLRDVMDPHTRG